MLTIGLTGGVGCGKSTVAALFRQRGAPVIDADVITRELTAPGTPCLRHITATLGAHLLLSDGQLDRRALRQLVFADSAARKQLEAILHPQVRTEIARRLDQLSAPYAIAVIPLLVETGMRYITDRVLVIDCDESQQIRRVAARDDCSPDAVRAIIASQASRDTRLAFADDVIENGGVAENLETEVARLHSMYLELAAGHGPRA